MNQKNPSHVPDISTQLALQRTNLGMERNYLAAERTLMAWIRTALSMMSFGFTIGKFAQALDNIEIRKWSGGTRTIGFRSLAYLFLVLGTLALFGATLRHLRRVRELRAKGLQRQISISFTVATILVLVGVFALSSLLLNL